MELGAHHRMSHRLARKCIISCQFECRLDFCTIRSTGPHTVLDAKCPAGLECDHIHQVELSHKSGATESQEFSLVRFPFPAFPSPSSIAPSSGPTGDEALPRRTFKLQNVASGLFLCAVGLNTKLEEPNVVARADVSVATEWYFVHTVQDEEWCQFDDMFAIATRRGAHRATLDHWYGRFTKATYGRFFPTNRAHMWKVVPRDGAFTFRNLYSNQILGQSLATGEVVPRAAASTGDPTCQWKLVDVATGEPCRVLYDSTLSILPPELLSTAPSSTPARGQSLEVVSGSEPVLRTALASPVLCQRFLDTLEHDHELIRQMLRSGYTSLVVAPQLVRGWKDGRVHNMSVQEEEVLRLWEPRGKYNYDGCER